MSLLDLVVAHRSPLTDQVIELELRRPDGGALPPFEAGAHIDVHVAEGLVRQYSLCQSPDERDCYRIAVLREPASRGGSAGVHDTLMRGAAVRVSEPRNHFPLAPRARRSILAAGGIGVTPLYAMAEVLWAGGEDFVLHYCVRDLAHAAFDRRLRAAPFVARAVLHLDNGPWEQRFDLDAALGARDADDHLYVCGPPGFMEWVLEGAAARGWPRANLHREYFSAPAKPHEPGDAFDLKLARTGRTVRVGPGETALEALRGAGLDAPSSCEQGVCGTCLTRVLAGEPDHRDYFMTTEEQALNDQFTPCCSRSRTPVLEVDL